MRTDKRSQAERQCTYTATARRSSGHNPQYLLALLPPHVPLAKEEEEEVLREADSCRGKLSPSRGLVQKIVLALTGESKQV